MLGIIGQGGGNLDPAWQLSALERKFAVFNNIITILLIVVITCFINEPLYIRVLFMLGTHVYCYQRSALRINEKKGR